MSNDVVACEHNLVILSIPFQRLIRSHLSAMVLDTAGNGAHILIVSPFAEHKEFTDGFTNINITHINILNKPAPTVIRKIRHILTIIRTHGYWLKNKKFIPYYWENRHKIFKKNFQVAHVHLLKRIFFNVLAIAGCLIPKFERLLECLIGFYIYPTHKLEQFADQFKGGVTLVQAASWGEQDQFLAFLARKKKWRTVLLPYTTDQLFCNGNLYCTYDAVCVQGEYEEKFALEVHKIPRSNVVKAGSAYLRVLEAIESASRISNVDTDQGNNLTVMYAGLVSEFFPVGLEIEVLNRLILLKKEKPNLNIVYRPASIKICDADFIKSKLIQKDSVEFQIPSPTSLGLIDYIHTDSVSDLKNLLNGLRKIDIMITSLTTSLSIEAAFLGIPSIGYFPIENREINMRRVDLMLNTAGRIIGFESIPVSTSLEALMDELKIMCGDASYRASVARDTARAWDFSGVNFIEQFGSALFQRESNYDF